MSSFKSIGNLKINFIINCSLAFIYIYTLTAIFYTEVSHIFNSAQSTCGSAGVSLVYSCKLCRIYDKQGNCHCPVNFYLASQTFCWSLYFVTEKTQVDCRLLQKDPCKMSQWLFAVMRSRMTEKFWFRQADPTEDFRNMFRLSSVQERGKPCF